MSLKHIGDIVLWDSPGAVPHDKVVEAANEISIELGKIVPKAPTDRTVLQRVSVTARERGKNHVPVFDDGEEVILEVNQVNKRGLDDGKPHDTKQTKYETIGAVVLDKSTGAIDYDGPASVAQTVEAFKASRNCIMRDEWTQMALNVIKKESEGRMMRRGVYWVAVNEDGEPVGILRDLQALFAKFGGMVTILRTTDDPESLSSLRLRIELSIVQELEELLKGTMKLRSRDAEEVTRPSTWNRRWDKLKALRERVVYFSVTLSMDFTKVEDRLDEEEAKIIEDLKDAAGDDVTRFMGMV